MTFDVQPIGRVVSTLGDRLNAPRQPDEDDAPSARIELDPTWAAAADGLEPGQQIVLLTWLHLGDRETLHVHPRGDTSRPAVGVFATRSPDRPNPIGLHTVTLRAVDGTTLTVESLEAVDGTPVIDIKPTLGRVELR